MTDSRATIEEYWSFDGVPLHQHAWSVSTLGGTRMGVPPLRGDNVRIAYRPGSVPRTKVPDERVLTLLMWVAGIDNDSGAPASDQNLAWNDNWNALRRLFFVEGERELTRIWKLTRTVGEVPTPTLVSATALASLAGTLEPSMTGRSRADFSVDLLLSDPFFYGEEEDFELVVDTPTTVTNQGDWAADRSVEITLTGPLTTPVLTNSTPATDVVCRLDATLAEGVTLTLDVANMTARTNTGAELMDKVVWSGARRWMLLDPGENALTLTASAGTGSALLRLAPPYV